MPPEAREAWLAGLDRYLMLGRPAERVVEDMVGLHVLLPTLPVRVVPAGGLRALLADHGLEPPESYAQLVDLEPGEIGADRAGRYVLRDARLPCDLPDVGRTDRLASAPAPRGPRPDALDRLDDRISLVGRARRVARERAAVDLLGLASLDGYGLGLEHARLYVTTRRGLILP
jgi:hypothetical protein